MATSPVTVNGVIGLDGIQPVYQPEARWCWWEINEIYTGAQGAKRYVPKVNDFVMDAAIHAIYRVAAINPVSLLSTLVATSAIEDDGSFSNDDVLFGVGPGTQSDTYIVYVDDKVLPHAITVDARLKIGGTASSYAKLYRGSDVSSSGKVISRLYDASGSLLTLNIPLELAAINSFNNHSIKVISPCHTNETLINGEIVTAVIYNDVGHVVSKRQLLVENTSFIRSVNAGQKYISHISLETPFLSSSNAQLIEFPINVPVAGMGLIGVVHYSDGTSLRMPVDGRKFSMLGLSQYLGTIVGQQVSLVLTYNVSPDETVYGAVTSDGKKVTKPYKLISQAQNGAYAVKLFGYPVWVSPAEGYKLRWFLYTLDRNVTYDVTNYVRFNTNSGAFNPLAYGFLQNLSVSINLREVNGSFKSYIHVQSISFVLLEPGDERTTNWTIGFDPEQTPRYGIGLFGKAHIINQNLWKLKVDSDIPTFAEWLDKFYYNTKPIVDKQKEITPPTPNFFIVRCGNSSAEFPITDWNQELTYGNGPVINDTMYIEFIKRTSGADIKLSVAGVPTYDY